MGELVYRVVRSHKVYAYPRAAVSGPDSLGYYFITRGKRKIHARPGKTLFFERDHALAAVAEFRTQMISQAARQLAGWKKFDPEGEVRDAEEQLAAAEKLEEEDNEDND